MNHASLKKIPETPGCYLMKDIEDNIIYVGKAKNLHKRVNSYFTKTHDEPKTQELVKYIDNVDFIVTDNEVEALLLESKLIRNHQPKYNIALKDTVKYAYLKITKERFPIIVTTRKNDGEGRYYGPFTSGKARALAERLSNRLFKIRVCTTLPKRACLLYYLGECSAPCIGKIDEKSYGKQIKKAEMFLKGKSDELVKTLEREMLLEAKKLHFEQAQEIKEQIQSLKHLTEKQKIEMPKLYDQNVINYLTVDDQILIQIFRVKKGVVSGRNEFRIDTSDESIESFIKQYYFLNSIPKEIIIPEPLNDQDILEAYLTQLKNENVKITVPKIGYKKQLLEMVAKNITIKLEDEPLNELKKILNLPKIPREIDCFDISNISGTYATGSCVRFSNAKPNKNLYRHFKIKTVRGINDFAMMHEVVKRRYQRKPKEELPDLIVIDGGKGQLNTALGVLHGLKLDIPLISLAKKLEEVYVADKQEPYRIPYESYGLKLLQQIRDEAHRFAVTYHKLLRSKGFIPK
ncbi:MAG TPA: excinuclease ABC subunit UvrC [Patescibacteria group bacterium]|nr:excinuclease ABC subunit UvrC [Patescibacteria group bacterium]